MTKDERKILEQKKFILNLEKEILTLEKEINNTNSVNARIDLIKNIKKTLCGLGFIIPPSLIGTFGFYTGIKIFGYPFIFDDIKIYLHEVDTIDSNNLESKELFYDDFRETPTLTYYSSYTKDKDKYKREKKVYDISTISNEDIKSIVSKEISIESVLKDSEDSIEYINYKPDNMDELIVASINKISTTDYITEKENIYYNIITSTAFFGYISFLVAVYFNLTDKLIKFTYMDLMDRIDNKYKHVDVEESERKLKTRKDNLERLLRR